MALFTQKHFVALAEVIHQTRVKIRENGFEHPSEVFETNQRLLVIADFTMELIQMFKKDNPKFDQFKFIEACSKDLIYSA